MSRSSQTIDSSGSRFSLSRLFVAVAIAAVAAWFLRLAVILARNEDGDIIPAIASAHFTLVLLAMAVGFLYRQAAVFVIAGLWLLITATICVPWLYVEWSLRANGS